MTLKNIFFTLAVLFPTLSFADGLPAGSFCSASWQCSGDLLCRGGICVDYDEEGNLGRGAMCYQSWQCAGDLYCRPSEYSNYSICTD